MNSRRPELIAAIVSLHEQAHNLNAIRFCTQDPCRHLVIEWTGPAATEPIGRTKGIGEW